MLTQTASGTVDSATKSAVDEPNLIEPVFVSGVAHAKVIGGLLYMALFVEQPGDWHGGERIIQARLIMPISALMEGRAKVDTALKEHGMKVLSRAS